MRQNDNPGNERWQKEQQITLLLFLFHTHHQHIFITNRYRPSITKLKNSLLSPFYIDTTKRRSKTTEQSDGAKRQSGCKIILTA